MSNYTSQLTAYQVLVKMSMMFSVQHNDRYVKAAVDRDLIWPDADNSFFQIFATKFNKGQWFMGAVAPIYEDREKHSYLVAFPYYWEPIFRRGIGTMARFQRLRTMSDQTFKDYFSPKRALLHIKDEKLFAPKDAFYASAFDNKSIEQCLAHNETTHKINLLDEVTRYEPHVCQRLHPLLESGMLSLQSQYLRLGGHEFDQLTLR